MKKIDCRTLAQEDWMDTNFQDKRLNKRVINIAESFMKNPFTTPPKALKELKNTKAFYRFMDSEKVDHSTLIEQHCAKAKSSLNNRGTVLVVHDDTTATFKRNFEIEGLYDVGNIPGLVVHNAISVIPKEGYGMIDGLLHQSILDRKPKEIRDSEYNESDLWVESIKAVGNYVGTKIVHVMDRFADSIGIMHVVLEQNHDFIIRAQHNRLTEEDKYLLDFARSLPITGTSSIEVQANKGRKRRKAKLNISFSKIDLKKPKNKPQLECLSCNIIRVFEPNPPDEQEPIEWFILTSLDVKSLEDAVQIVRYYSYRWIVEEYHKCIKTGFRLEQTQLETRKRIEALIGFISVCSVRLLQLRDIVRVDPRANAEEYVEKEDIKIVKAYYKVSKDRLTIDEFLRYIAQMGGFLNRKSDGRPGWQTLWEGWKFFMGLKAGVQLFKEETYG